MNAYFAGGCFWCITSVFAEHKGVIKVTSGYCGGLEINPTYQDVKAQKTGHRDTINVEYDENIVSFEELLEIFINNVDLYDEGGQFIDRGHSYTLAIYYVDDKQKEVINQRFSKFDKPVCVSIEEFVEFYDAEEYYQDYYLKHPKEFEEELISSGRKQSK